MVKNSNGDNEIQRWEQMVNAQIRLCPGKLDAQILLGFWDSNRSTNLGQTTRLSNNQQKKRTCRIAVSAAHRIKLKESEH